MNNIKNAVAAGIAAFFSWFGLLAVPLLLLVPCQMIDWFTGIAAAKIQGIKIESKVSYQGIVKKVCMYLLIFVGWVLDLLIAYIMTNMNITFVLPNIVACFVAVWLILNELISITENVDIIGVHVPFLSPIMRLIKEKVEDTVHVEEHEEAVKNE